MALFGKTDTAASRPKYLPVGQVTTVNITNGGTGYSTPTITFSAPPAGGVTATGTLTVTSGVITSVNITNPGAGYTSAPTITITGAGTGGALSAVIAPINYDHREIFLVDTTEAAIPANKAKGITQAGWWWIREYYAQGGNPRYKVECLVVLPSATQATAGDANDDATVADVDATVVISAQPTNQTTISGAATFSVTATITPTGTPIYQWQIRPNGNTRYSNIVGATSASLALTGRTSVNSGDQYRVIISSANGAKKTVSSTATLSFGN